MVDPTDIPNVADVFDPEFTVLLYEFKADIAAYLSELRNTSMRTLADLIAFNEANADPELRWFGQEIFLLAEATTGGTTPPTGGAGHLQAPVPGRHRPDHGPARAGRHRQPHQQPPWTTDLVNGDHFLTASSTPSAVSGYPNITVPAGFSSARLPVGINFIGRRWSEPTLLKLAYGFEQGTRPATPPGSSPRGQGVPRHGHRRPQGRGRHRRPRRDRAAGPHRALQEPAKVAGL